MRAWVSIKAAATITAAATMPTSTSATTTRKLDNHTRAVDVATIEGTHRIIGITMIFKLHKRVVCLERDLTNMAKLAEGMFQFTLSSVW